MRLYIDTLEVVNSTVLKSRGIEIASFSMKDLRSSKLSKSGGRQSVGFFVLTRSFSHNNYAWYMFDFDRKYLLYDKVTS